MRDFRASIKDDETVTQPLNRAPGAVTSAGGGFGGGVTMPVDGFGGYGGAAFYDCGALETVTLGNSVRKIRGYAFFRCAGFDHIELPKSLVHIEEYAFYGCSALESILYNGTPNDWMKVTVEDGNYPFQDTQIGMTRG